MILSWEARPDPMFPGAWRVEPVDYRRHGQGFVAIFTGDHAWERAQTYCVKKNCQSIDRQNQAKDATPQETHP